MDEHYDGRTESNRRVLPCRFLRTKTTYTAPPGELPEYDGDTSTAHFWCVRTMKPIGPDGDLCEPELCGPDRLCCEPV